MRNYGKYIYDFKKCHSALQYQETSSFFKINTLSLLYLALILPMILILSTGNNVILGGYIFSFLMLLNYRKKLRALKFLFALLFLIGIWQGYTSAYIKLSISFGSMFIYILIKMLPSAMLGSILMLDIEASELISALGTLKIPKPLILSLTVAVKFFPTYRREFKYIKESMVSRGIKYKVTQPLNYFEYFVVPMLFRSYHLAEEMSGAALTKGVEAKTARTCIYDVSIRKIDWLLIVISTLCFIYVLLRRC